jgi:hypothetical protein
MGSFKRDLAREMQDRAGVLVVGAGDSRQTSVSAYAASRAAAEAAAQVASEVAGQHQLAARISVECWRPGTKQWADASTVSERDLAEDHEHQQQEDRRVSAETGVAQWRVHVELRTHRAAVALAKRLTSDGHHVDRGWSSVAASANCEDDANNLAEKIRHYAPPGAEVVAERTDTPTWSAPFVSDWGGPLMR